jgi:cytochrome c-type biogenesis protein CcmH/NrfG
MTQPAPSSLTRVLILAAVIAVGVAAISWTTHYMVVADSREKGDAKRKADSVAAAAQQPQEDPALRARKVELLERLEKALVDHPKDSMLIISAANAAYDLQRFDLASKYYKVFIETIDGANESVHIDYGYAVFSMGEQQRGLDIVEDVVRRDPKNQTALYNLAIMTFQMQNADAAASWLKKCIDAGPNTPIGERAARTLQALQSAT